MVKPRIDSILLEKLIAPGSAFAITFLFLVIQYIFKLELQCPCDPTYNAWFCGLYMFCPTIIIFCVLTLTAQKATAFCCGTCCWPSCSCKTCFKTLPFTPPGCFIFKHFARNVILSFLWIITLLIDGDIVACWSQTDSIKPWNEQIPCKEKEKRTPEESSNLKRVQTISQIAGLGFILALPAVWLIIRCTCWLCKNPYEYLYEDLYEDEALNLAETNLREKAKSTAKDNYSRHSELKDCKDWMKYSKHMASFLDDSTPSQQNEPENRQNENSDRPNENPEQQNLMSLQERQTTSDPN